VQATPYSPSFITRGALLSVINAEYYYKNPLIALLKTSEQYPLVANEGE
jgi:hypothetical protein